MKSVGPKPTFAYGYRFGEVDLPRITTECKNSAVIGHIHRDGERRVVVQSSLGCHVKGVALPHPDPNDFNTTILGVAKRFAAKPPEADEKLRQELRDFVTRWLHKNLTPLDSTADCSFDSWLDKTPYPRTRKQELRDAYDYGIQFGSEKRDFVVKAFVKDETYPEYKHSRVINSRSDAFKCKTGPIFRLIEEVLYVKPYFIKHVPVADRPANLKECLRGWSHFYPTDYTSFESLFERALMLDVEYQLYDYMTAQLPMEERDDFLRCIRNYICGMNEIQFKQFTMFLEATRMSGEMNTSLGNGFSNLMFMLFVIEKCGLQGDGRVEGDDALFGVSGKLDESLFTRLGLRIKVEQVTEPSEASFCGIVCDLEEQINVTNPIEVLASFGWSRAIYARAAQRTKMKLLRCKALSYAHQYPGCPIIDELAKYGLRVTRSYDVRHFVKEKMQVNTYEREQLLTVLDKRIPQRCVGMKTRLLVERKYGITVELQHAIEKYLRNLDAVQELDLEFAKPIIPSVWENYYDHYVISGDHFGDQLNIYRN